MGSVGNQLDEFGYGVTARRGLELYLLALAWAFELHPGLEEDVFNVLRDTEKLTPDELMLIKRSLEKVDEYQAEAEAAS